MSALLARLRQARARYEADTSRAPQTPSTGSFRCSRTTASPDPHAAGSLSTLAGRELGPTTIAVLDLETTGLHGAGTVPFVVGLALWRDDRVQVVQWTLQSMGGERAMLRSVLETLEREAPTHLLTYNGSSFDRPLLLRRLARHRLESDALMLPHLDVLVVARRLLRDCYEDCRLATLERALLGVVRHGDIPGAEIPQVFFDLLEAPTSPRARQRLARVVAHNRQDVVSTLGLLGPLAELVRAPGGDWEALRVARHFLREQRPALALVTLRRFDPERWVHSALPASTLSGAHLLAEVQRMEGQTERAAEVWHAIAEACPGDPVAHERLAKHYEHRCGDPRAALRFATESTAACSHRIERLQRKVQRLV